MTRIIGGGLRTLSENIRFRTSLYLGYRSFTPADGSKSNDLCMFQALFTNIRKRTERRGRVSDKCTYFPHCRMLTMNKCAVKVL